MGRPIKIGLDYFPLDTDVFDDYKLQFVASRFDEKGEIITLKLLCRIYKACGYYMPWDDDTALLFSKGAGRNITPSLANEVVNELVKRDFFHRGLFERFAILTSAGIQKRYIKICTDSKRKDWEIELKYDVNEFTTEETRLTQEFSTQSKGKETKEKNRKALDATAPSKKSFKNFTEDDFVEELKFFKDQYGKDEVLNPFFKYWKERSAGGKMRFQLEKTWETGLRLEKWRANNQKQVNGTHQQSSGGINGQHRHNAALDLLAKVEQDLASRRTNNA